MLGLGLFAQGVVVAHLHQGFLAALRIGNFCRLGQLLFERLVGHAGGRLCGELVVELALEHLLDARLVLERDLGFVGVVVSLGGLGVALGQLGDLRQVHAREVLAGLGLHLLGGPALASAEHGGLVADLHGGARDIARGHPELDRGVDVGGVGLVGVAFFFGPGEREHVAHGGGLLGAQVLRGQCLGAWVQVFAGVLGGALPPGFSGRGVAVGVGPSVLAAVGAVPLQPLAGDRGLGGAGLGLRIAQVITIGGLGHLPQALRHGASARTDVERLLHDRLQWRGADLTVLVGGDDGHLAAFVGVPPVGHLARAPEQRAGGLHVGVECVGTAPGQFALATGAQVPGLAACVVAGGGDVRLSEEIGLVLQVGGGAVGEIQAFGCKVHALRGLERRALALHLHCFLFAAFLCVKRGGLGHLRVVGGGLLGDLALLVGGASGQHGAPDGGPERQRLHRGQAGGGGGCTGHARDSGPSAHRTCSGGGGGKGSECYGFTHDQARISKRWKGSPRAPNGAGSLKVNPRRRSHRTLVVFFAACRASTASLGR